MVKTLYAVSSATSGLTDGILETNTGNNGTILNVLGTVSFTDYYPAAFSGGDLTTPFQQFLYDANQKALALIAANANSDGNLAGRFVRAVCPRMTIGVTCPIIVPEYVALDMPGVVFERVGVSSLYSTTVSTNYSSGSTSLVVASVSGIPAFPFYIKIGSEVLKVTNNAGTTLTVAGAQLGTSAANHNSPAAVNLVSTAYTGDTTSKALYVLEQPIMLFPSHSANLSLLQTLLNSNGSDRGSGPCFGKNWVPSAATLVSSGNGQYAVNDVLKFPQPSITPFTASQLTVTGTDGSAGGGLGNITSSTLSTVGVYPLPSAAQASLWTVANGYTGAIANGAKGGVFTSDGSGVYITSSNNAGGGTGTGATFSLAYTADFAGSGADYYGGTYILNSIYSGDVFSAQSAITNDAVFGHTFAAYYTGAQHVMGTVTTQSGYYGIRLDGTDYFWTELNPVDSGIGLKLGSGGGAARGFVTVDSPTLAFIEQDNFDNVNIVADFTQKNGASYTGSYCMQLGENGGSSIHLNSATTYKINISENCGAGGIPALQIANTVDFDIQFNIANTVKAGTEVTYPVTSVATLGSNVTNGSISAVLDHAASITSGTIDPTVSINVWDSTAKQRVKNENLFIKTGYVETAAYSNGNSTTSFALNMDNGPLQTITISGAVTITQTAPTNPGKYTLIATQDGTGHVYSFSGVTWAGGSQPTWSTAMNKKDVVSFVYDGSTWYGMGGVAFS